MATKYTKINESVEARVHDEYLYVRLTGVRGDMLVQGEYVGKTYRLPYTGTLEDAQITNEHGISDIDRCIESGAVIRQGRLIQ